MTTWFWLSYLVLAATVVVLGLMVMAQQRKLSHLELQFLRSREPVPVEGSLRMDGELTSVPGRRAVDMEPASWEQYVHERSGVLIVLNAACPPCRALADELSTPAAGPVLGRAVVVIEGPDRDARALVAGNGLLAGRALLVMPGAVEGWLGGAVSPLAAVIEGGRLVRAVQVHSLDQVRRFLARVDARHEAGSPAQPAGDGHELDAHQEGTDDEDGHTGDRGPQAAERPGSRVDAAAGDGRRQHTEP